MPTEFDALRIRNAALSSELDAETMRNDALPIEQAASTNQPEPGPNTTENEPHVRHDRGADADQVLVREAAS